MVSKHDIFLCLNFIYCAFCSDLKIENIRALYKEDVKSEGVQKFYFLFKSYLATQIWDSFQRPQHWRKKDYKISLTYFIVTKISKSILKIQITSTDRCRSRAHYRCLFPKRKEDQNLFASVLFLTFPNFSLFLI